MALHKNNAKTAEIGVESNGMEGSEFKYKNSPVKLSISN